jgi:glutathione synthase/RimK-type ligase-like ATP-grasp enzyme
VGTVKLYAYNNGSASAKALAAALGIKRLKHEGKLIRFFNQDILINWGASKFERNIEAHWDNVLNQPQNVAKAVNKLTTLKTFKEAGVVAPDWTEAPVEALEWLHAGFIVVARTVLNGHSGQGIVIMNGAAEFVDAPLYTKYIKKDQEYRIHVFQGEAFFVQRKARKMDVPAEQVNWQVRNLAGGFIYANQNVECPDVYKVEACKAIAALGLDFGAVDLITDKKTQLGYVLEVNTACGLAGTTLDKYVEVFRNFL